ncbi:MAG: hypothetical protein WCL11_06965 [Verrucomicrobiota bacterium]
MNAVEFTTQLSGAAVLPIPGEIAAQPPKSGKARTIVLTDEAEWCAGAYEQFLRDEPECYLPPGQEPEFQGMTTPNDLREAYTGQNGAPLLQGAA